MVKVGFDIHGVLDTFAVYQSMARKMIEDEFIEVYVITGLAREEADKEIGHIIDLDRVKYFSIADYLEGRPDVEVTWIDGMPWADEEAWNRAKADFCHEEGIDILFDDSESYAPTFNDIATIYCQVHNPNRTIYKRI